MPVHPFPSRRSTRLLSRQSRPLRGQSRSPAAVGPSTSTSNRSSSITLRRRDFVRRSRRRSRAAVVLTFSSSEARKQSPVKSRSDRVRLGGVPKGGVRPHRDHLPRAGNTEANRVSFEECDFRYRPGSYLALHSRGTPRVPRRTWDSTRGSGIPGPRLPRNDESQRAEPRGARIEEGLDRTDDSWITQETEKGTRVILPEPVTTLPIQDMRAY